jgi:hypothetical protein
MLTTIQSRTFCILFCCLKTGDRSQLLYILTELSPSWEAASCAATHEFSSILWNLKVHHRVHKSPPLSPYPEPDRSCLYHPISLRSVLISCNHLRLGLPSGLFRSSFPTNIPYALPFSPIRATCPARLILPYMIILIIFGEGISTYDIGLNRK